MLQNQINPVTPKCIFLIDDFSFLFFLFFKSFNKPQIGFSETFSWFGLYRVKHETLKVHPTAVSSTVHAHPCRTMQGPAYHMSCLQ